MAPQRNNGLGIEPFLALWTDYNIDDVLRVEFEPLSNVANCIPRKPLPPISCNSVKFYTC